MTPTPGDRAQIRDLVERYAVLVDARDFAGVGALFLPDGRLVLPEPPRCLDPVRDVHGRSAIEAALEQLRAFDQTFHGVSALAVESGGHSQAATGRVNGIAQHLSRGQQGTSNLEWRTRYRDRYQRTESGWLFAERSLGIVSIDVRAVKRVNAPER